MAVVLLGDDDGCQATCPKCKAVMTYDHLKDMVGIRVEVGGKSDEYYHVIICPRCGVHFDPEGWKNGR